MPSSLTGRYFLVSTSPESAWLEPPVVRTRAGGDKGAIAGDGRLELEEAVSAAPAGVRVEPLVVRGQAATRILDETADLDETEDDDDR